MLNFGLLFLIPLISGLLVNLNFLTLKWALRLVIFNIFFDLWLALVGLYFLNFQGNIPFFRQKNFNSSEDIFGSYLNFGPWLQINNFSVNWEFTFNTLTLSLIATVLFVSFLVHLYSVDYLYLDPKQRLFFSFLSLFTFFMVILVSSSNFLILFVGWEGVGLCSYLLINFWYTRPQANKSALKALVINRIGDVGLTFGILLIYLEFNSLNFSDIFLLVPFFAFDKIFFIFSEVNTLELICIFLFIGAMGKSAQVGLHAWLPDAMEGPTPVSALIHAATMVTAGVFLLIRCSVFLEFAPKTLAFITNVGALTCFLSGLVGLVQFDIKKIIAYSTCSQLGYMVFACGLNQFFASFFHLINHAFFKALLFLASGSIIHALGGEQDIRKFGGLLRVLPLTYSALLIGSLCLCGFPFLSGYYSKELILELAFISLSTHGLFAYILGLAAAFCTTWYSFRLIYYTFFTKSNGYRTSYFMFEKTSFYMRMSLIILIIPSIFSGYLLNDIFIGVASDFWPQNIYQLKLALLEFIPLHFKILPFISTLLACILSYLFLVKFSFSIHLYFFFQNLISDSFLVKFFRYLGKQLYYNEATYFFVI